MNHKYSKFFLESRSSNVQWNICKTLLQTSIFWLTFLIFIPFVIHWLEISFQLPQFNFALKNIVAVSVFVLASLLGLSSGMTMAINGEGTPLPLDCTKKLVVRGPYRYVRNPMAIAGLVQGTAVGIWLGSWSILLYVLVGMFLWDRIVRPIEEFDLQQRFGDKFEDYQKKVRCWVPNREGYKDFK